MRWPGETLVLLSLLCCGCATYGFDVVQPAVADRAIGGDQWTSVTIDPLVYKLRADEGRLVMQIFNPTGDAIELLGDKSTVVDPDGQSHPMHSETIAAGSFISEVFPPMEDETQSGAGYQYGAAAVVGSPGYIPPQGYGPAGAAAAASPDAAYYWDWNGEAEVRMTLVYGRGNSNFSHAFMFQRVKQ
jgi:hypothetical protein